MHSFQDVSRALALALALPTVVVAQDAGRDLGLRLVHEVSAQLRSEDLATIAWGGWVAGERHLTETEDLLRGTLRRLAERPFDERKFAVLAVLDGLVRIGATSVTFDELEPHLKGITHDPALILVARQPLLHARELLDLYERHGDGNRLVWQMCGNLLVERAPRAFAPAVLAELGVELKITVMDSDVFGGGGRGVSSGGAFGDGRLDVPEGYPPTVMYTISDRGDVGDVVLAPGERPIYYKRKVRRETRFGFGSSRRTIERMPIRFEWVATMLGTSTGALGLEPKMRGGIDVRREEYLPSAIAARQRVLTQFDELVSQLREKGLLSPEEADVAQLEVVLSVQDVREDSSVALPEIPPVGQ